MIPPVRIGSPILLLAAALAGGQNPAPRFDVASIRPVTESEPDIPRDRDFTSILPGGRFDDSRTTLYSMVALAYNLRNPSLQLLGLPKWAGTQRYAVSAKAAEGFPLLSPAEDRERVRAMMRAMLEDRFHLQLHTETRQERVYHLEVARGGPRIKEADAPVPPATPGFDAVMGDSGGRLRARKATMAYLATALTGLLRGWVVDRTGLAGYYDFDVRWTAMETDQGRPSTGGLGAEGVALFFANFESLTGLRLTRAVGPVEFWVVDHVDPPTAN